MLLQKALEMKMRATKDTMALVAHNISGTQSMLLGKRLCTFGIPNLPGSIGKECASTRAWTIDLSLVTGRDDSYR